MTCSRMERDGMRYIDGEMSDEERTEFQNHLGKCDDCSRTMRELHEVNRLTGRIAMKDPQDEFWEHYWKSIYRRLERKTAWVFVLLGAGMLIGYEAYSILSNFGRVTFEKVALIIFLAGIIFLVVSVVRERLHQHRSDPYRDVKR